MDSPEGEDVSDLVRQYCSHGRVGRYITTGNVLAAKRNEGARQSNGGLLIFLDDDLRIPTGFVRAHVAAHDSRPALVSGQIVFPTPWVRERNYYRYKSSRHLNSKNGATRTTDIPAHRVVAMNCSVSARAFEQVGGFAEIFVHYGGEDAEFGFRCARHGLELLYSPDPVGVHQEVEGDVTTFIRKIYIASLTSTLLLLSAAPEASAVPTVRWTEPGIADNTRDKAAHLALRLLSRAWLLRRILHVLESTDRERWLYSPLAYKAVTLMAAQLGGADRRAGRDRRETPRGEAAASE